MRYLFLFLFLFFFSSSSFADTLIIEPDAGRSPLFNAIHDAKSSIDIVMYGFTDQELLNALIQAKNNGKNITILLEPTPYQSLNENTRVIRQLRAENINLVWPSKTFHLTHQKTFILDQATAIVMTFNLTRGSFNHERNFALVVTNPDEVQEIKKVFAADCLHKKISVSNANLVWSPDNASQKMLQLIQSAHSDIEIYAQNISDYQIIGALAKASHAGKHIKILLSVSPRKLHNRKFSFLKKAGVVIHNSQHYYIHAKVMIIDHQRALLGSINLTKPSLENNRELSVITDESDVVKQLVNVFDKDWS